MLVDWTFDEVLAAINSLPSIPTPVLESADGLCLGDVCFAKIRTTLQDVHAVSLALLEKLVDNRGFNLEHRADGDYSHSHCHTPCINSRCSTKGHREHGDWAGCLLVHGAPLSPISSIPNLISYVCDMLKFEESIIQS